eukprot:1101861-Amphidinium_carterae.1
MAEIRKGMKKGKRKAKAPAPTYCAPNDARCTEHEKRARPVSAVIMERSSEWSGARGTNHP